MTATFHRELILIGLGGEGHRHYAAARLLKPSSQPLFLFFARDTG